MLQSLTTILSTAVTSLNLVMCSGIRAQHICIVDPADLDVSLYYCLVLGLDDLMTLMLGNCLF